MELLFGIIGLIVFIAIKASNNKNKAAKQPQTPQAESFREIRTGEYAEQPSFGTFTDESTVPAAQTAPASPVHTGAHDHPAAAVPHRDEYVPVTGSLAAEARAQGEIEGSEDLANLRLVETTAKARTSRSLTKDDIVRGVIMSEVLGKRGGRRAL